MKAENPAKPFPGVKPFPNCAWLLSQQIAPLAKQKLGGRDKGKPTPTHPPTPTHTHMYPDYNPCHAVTHVPVTCLHGGAGVGTRKVKTRTKDDRGSELSFVLSFCDYVRRGACIWWVRTSKHPIVSFGLGIVWYKFGLQVPGYKEPNKRKASTPSEGPPDATESGPDIMSAVKDEIVTVLTCTHSKPSCEKK